jgi:hypothetical protein
MSVRLSSAALTIAACGGSPAGAHHSFAAEFSYDKIGDEITIEGTLEEYWERMRQRQ